MDSRQPFRDIHHRPRGGLSSSDTGGEQEVIGSFLIPFGIPSDLYCFQQSPGVTSWQLCWGQVETAQDDFQNWGQLSD